jgi:hypothetical protein
MDGLMAGGTIIFTLVIIVVSFVAAIVPIVLVFRWLGKMQAEKHALLRSGAFGHARILQLGQTGTYLNNQPQLQLMVEVTPMQQGGYPAAMAFQSSFTQFVPMMAMARVQPGAVVPVRYDPMNPAKMTIDFQQLGFM